jgi:NDP-sugar pyrophosphorylase family protein
LIGAVLIGGTGERVRPLTQKAPGYLRSKAALSFCGQRVIWWLLQSMKGQGISEFLVIARGKENRYQTKMLVGFGEELGVRIRYSPVRFDALNTGNADAALRDFEYWGVDEPTLVFPSDSLYEFSLEEMYEVHQSNAALVTVAAMVRSAAEVAGKYGAMRTSRDGRVTAFLEKPSLSRLLHPAFGLQTRSHLGEEPIFTNAGMYLVEAGRVRKYAQEPDLFAARELELDFGKDLLPWLVRRDLPVYAHPATVTGDLGTVPDYLDTMVMMLRGEFPSLLRHLGIPLDSDRRIWIPAETLQLPDAVSGKTLEEKLEQGLVRLGDNVRLGRYVEVGVGTYIADSNVDDGVEIGEGVNVRRSAIREGVRIGAGAAVHNSYVGTMSQVDSTLETPTRLERHVALADEVVVEAGVFLGGPLSAHPRERIRRDHPLNRARRQ